MPFITTQERACGLDNRGSWEVTPRQPDPRGLGITLRPIVRTFQKVAGKVFAETVLPTLPPRPEFPELYRKPTWFAPYQKDWVEAPRLVDRRRTRVSPPQRPRPLIVISKRTLPAVLPAPPPPKGEAPPYYPPYLPPPVPTTPVATPEPTEDELPVVQKAGFGTVEMLVIAGVVLLVLPGLFKATKGRR